jgi:hypothetical protein
MENLNFMKLFLTLGSMTEQTREEEVAFKERIVFATPGIIKPEDWESLPLEEREKRLNKLTKTE